MIKHTWDILTVEYYSVIKINKILRQGTTWMNLKDITLSKKKKSPVSKGHIVYYSMYITFWKWQNYRAIEQISSYQGVGMVGGRRDETIKKIAQERSLQWWNSSESWLQWLKEFTHR